MDSPVDPKNVNPWLAQLSKLPDEQLFETARAVSALRDDPGFVAIQRLVTNMSNDYLRLLKHAKVKEHAEMARDLGLVAGLEIQSTLPLAIELAAAERQARREQELAQEEAKA